MTRLLQRGALGILVVVPVLALVVLRSNDGIDIVYWSARFHLVVVGGIAACATIVAVAAVSATLQTREAGPLFVAMGCLAVGVLMLAHGLTTPGILGQEANEWVGRLSMLALVLFVAGLLLAGARSDSAVHRLAARRPLVVVAVPTILGAVLAVAVVSDPARLHGAAPIPGEARLTVAGTALVVTGALRAAWVHWRRWRLGNDVVQFALMLAAAMTLAAATANQLGRFSRLSWWDYHGYLLAGFGGAVYAVHRRYRRTNEVSHALHGAFDDDPFDHIVRGYPEALRTLVRAMEIKDAYTHGHSARTARLAVELGQQLGLSPDRLRAVARGGYLHDIGKLGIPDQILNKPGRLTEDERRIIETHPRLGYELACGVQSLQEALQIILCHHERYDGDGYPAGLAGRDIPLEARVVSVADVWDALTSDRSYRPGWAPSEALAHIVDGRGRQFDPLVVDALVAVLAGRGIYGEDHGRADEAWNAAQTCHELQQPAAAS